VPADWPNGGRFAMERRSRDAVALNVSLMPAWLSQRQPCAATSCREQSRRARVLVYAPTARRKR